MTPILYLVIPCYNEEAVLPVTSGLFLSKITALTASGAISDRSRIVFVNDGSADRTWDIISGLCEKDSHYAGIALSHNRGHQNALICGLMECADFCDITISLDCDGQDDINCIDKMVEEYAKGSEIVYGVRNDRSTDSWFKRNSAETYYGMLKFMGVDIIPDHADYRLLSSRVIHALSGYGEVNLFLRGIIPQLGFKSSKVYYSRAERMAGSTHYPLAKMIALGMDGITSFSIKPLRMITGLGGIIAVVSFIGIIYIIVGAATGNTTQGWASMTCLLCFLSGIQMISLGVIGEYIGKIYLETKHRPRYIVDRIINIEEDK
ncbi:MAG: glycosyltransferase family 2 protein [Saccharofermentans sp.]|jgi:glycosyltransferase involved in cell wall biosynthesis|nr:glycosyltransferase family 2 protein [Mageeibacillus sp.]MCI1264283.1 glycosyltransferase family 2 protein [Saccharofermentans sp.]MCI1274960.1 glycosyltransferase family 2 protein [Saccharofermentans sp.]MCI1769462.1 glycosyltransferase family 2 protein [Mageeibacillus sp.]MCI2044447.1 glycosyltransferase family 2 protein [Mageeibacillus sp.]